MISSKNAFFSVLLAAAAYPASAVQKCVGPDGQVTYQERSCTATDKSAETLKLAPTPPTTAHDSRINAAIAMSQIVVGMSSVQAQRSWGAPTRINKSVGTYGTHEQWVYDRDHGRSQYVYIENGFVASVSSIN